MRAVDLFVDYQVAASQWVTTEGVKATSPGIGTVYLDFPLAPLTLSVLIGDCLQDLRSALDHEIYRQAEAVKGPKWPGLPQTQFPVHTDRKTFPSAQRRALAGIQPEVVSLVESLQPFVLPPDPIAETIALLHLAARIDRHRLLHIAAAQPTAHEVLGFRPDLQALEGRLTVRFQLIDFVEQRLMNLDVHNFLLASIAAVDTAIRRMREAEHNAASNQSDSAEPGEGSAEP